MPISLLWFLPTSGDSRTVVPFGPGGHLRPATIDYLSEIARAADRLGYEGVLTPTGTWCEDAWLVTAALIRETERLKFLVAFRPGAISPTLAAQKAATFQRLSGGRLLLNVVTGGDSSEQRRFGDWLDHDERYDRTDEFLSVLRGALGDEPYDFAGRYYQVEGATTSKPVPERPPLFFGGASPAAELVAAKHVDVYLAWGEPPAMVAGCPCSACWSAWPSGSPRAPCWPSCRASSVSVRTSSTVRCRSSAPFRSSPCSRS